jgi:hypothetical protein
MFNRSTRYMIIKLFTGTNETASRGLGGAVQHEIYNMGLRQSIRPLGSKTIQGVFCGKEADGEYGLAQPVPGRNPKWPTVVVEVGVSESYRKLRADAQWWLTNSRGDVKLVIIVSVSRKTPNIKFETVALDPLRPKDTADHYGIPRRKQPQLTDYHQASSSFDHWV